MNMDYLIVIDEIIIVLLSLLWCALLNIRHVNEVNSS